MKKRVLSLLLVLVMLLSLLPTAALADETQDQPSDQGEIVLDSEETTQEEPEREVDEVPAPEEPTEEPAPQVNADETTVFTDSTGKPVCGTHGTVNGEQKLTTDASGALRIDNTTVAATSYSTSLGTGYYYALPAGTYYLAGNLTLKSGIRIASGDVTLCLNGNNIELNRDVSTGGDLNYNVFTLEGGASLTLTDCQDTGSITQASTSSGRGVEVKRGATFTMYAGTITGHHLMGSNWHGLGVCVDGTFSMYGGSITNNSNNSFYAHGAGVYVGSKGAFTMCGGSITNNRWKQGAEGGGVYVSPDGSFTVSGDVVIKDNVCAKETDNDFADNVYLDKNSYYGIAAVLTIGKGGLGDNACIGIGAAGLDTPDAYAIAVQPAAGYTLTQNDFDHIYCDDTNYTKQLKDNTILLANGSPHFDHGICGDSTCKDTSHALPSGETWKPISDLSTITEAGCYYLTDNVELTDYGWTCQYNVTLCLNGHNITMNEDYYAITVGAGVTFTLTDCKGSSGSYGKITHGVNANGNKYTRSGVYVYGTFNLYGGSISGNADSGVNLYNDAYGDGIHAVFNMYGGEITDNTTSYSGAGVSISCGIFNMYGGEISGNTASRSSGGSVYVGNESTMTVSGNVNITGNTGGNVQLAKDKTIQITGKLAGDAKIGITYSGTIDSGKSVTVATGAAGNCTADNFSADAGEPYAFKVEAGEASNSINVNLYNGLPHKHPICGETCTDGVHNGEDDILTWKGVSALSEITGAGNYYLTQDVEITGGWGVENIAVNLCLNGHSITRKYNDIWQGAVITISGDNAYDKFGKLTLCDCNGSGKGNGKLTHEENAGGVGVQLQYVSAFDMYGGRITGNNNYGVNVGGSATFHMYGGSITENSYGVNIDGTMTVSGDVKITDNTNGNVDLLSGKTITVSGALGENAKIGVTTDIPDGSYVTVAEGSALTAADLDRFKRDNASYGKKLVDGSVIFYNGTLHEHAACGTKGCTEHTELSDEVWLPLTYSASESNSTPHLIYGGTGAGKTYNYTPNYYVLPAGNYYLYTDITTDLPIMINGDVNLCLNGYTITTTATLTTSGQALIKNDGHSLTICDCNGSGNGKGTVAAPENANGSILTTGALTMYGGTITGATTGVYVHTLNGSTGTFQMYGGTITGNQTGVSRYENANTLTFGGDAKVKDNTNINVSLLNNGTIAIDSSLTQVAKIGVYFTQAPADTETKRFATGATGDLDYAAIFSCDNGSDYVLTKDTDGNLYFGKHQHVWEYKAEGATITATCTAEGCDLTGCIGGTATLTAPTSPVVYDGKSKKATVTYDTAWNANVGTGYERTEYYQNNTKVVNVIDAGTYTAKLWVDKNQTDPAELTFTIARKVPEVGDFTFKASTNLVYDGTVKFAEVELVSGKNYYDCGAITYKYYDSQNNEVAEPKAPGTYTVKISVDDTGKNFTATTAYLENNDWTFIIGRGTQTVKVPKGKTVINNNVPVDIAGWATAAGVTNGEPAGEVSYELVNPPAGVTLKGTELSVASSVEADTMITVKATAAETDYYNATEQSFTVKVVNKTSAELKVTQENWTYGDTNVPQPTYDPIDGLIESTISVTYAKRGESTYKTEMPTAAGDYTVKVTLETSDTIYIGMKDFTIAQKPLSEVLIGEFGNQTYTGQPIHPTVIPTDNGGTKALTPGTDYTVSYGENTNVGEATITITGIGNYTGTVTRTFQITQADPTYTIPANLEATYGDTLAKVALPIGWTWNDPTQSVGDATGDGTTNFKAIYTPSNSNYKTVTDIDVPVKVNKAKGDSRLGEGYDQRFTDTKTHTVSLSWLDNFLPSGQNWSFTSSYTTTGKATVGYRLSDTGNSLAYKIENGSAGEIITFTFTAKCSNYEDFTYTVTVTLTDRNQQNIWFEGGLTEQNVTYGDKNFTVTARVKAPAQITYFSNDTNVAEVDPSTGEVTIKGAGEAIITATATQTDDYMSASASYTLKVSKKPIAIPTADSTEFTYTGKEQTYQLAENSAYTISGNKQTAANEGGYTVTVKLADTANTQWADNTTADKTYTFIINKATITITAKDQSAYVGDKAPTLGKDSYTVSGLVNGETLKGKPNVAYTSTPDMTKAGEVAIKVSGAVAPDGDNYTIQYVDGNLTIANRPSSGVPTYPVNTPSTADNGSVSASTKNAASGSTVTITVKPDEGYQLSGLTVTDSKGNVLTLTDLGNGKFSFTMPSGKVEVNATFAKEVEVSPFKDVAVSAYYYDAVKWAVENGITDGVGNGLFAPNTSCTRAQIVTFLWRASGSPEPKSMSSFKDVAADAYYAKAVAWAVENGITTGTATDKFSPNAPCTRAQSVTFLFRASEASADGTPVFSDVAANAYYAEAVKWAVDNGVTDGVGNGKFAPNDACTRAQIVTFLWRLHAGK